MTNKSNPKYSLNLYVSHDIESTCNDHNEKIKRILEIIEKNKDEDMQFNLNTSKAALSGCKRVRNSTNNSRVTFGSDEVNHNKTDDSNSTELFNEKESSREHRHNSLIVSKFFKFVNRLKTIVSPTKSCASDGLQKYIEATVHVVGNIIAEVDENGVDRFVPYLLISDIEF